MQLRFVYGGAAGYGAGHVSRSRFEIVRQPEGHVGFALLVLDQPEALSRKGLRSIHRIRHAPVATQRSLLMSFITDPDAMSVLEQIQDWFEHYCTCKSVERISVALSPHEFIQGNSPNQVGCPFGWGPTHMAWTVSALL